MDPTLDAFLARHQPLFYDSAVWADGRMPLRITGYLGTGPLPEQFVTSVRGIILKADTVMVVRTAWDEWHIVPGGRREPGETLEETLRREILEETAWSIDRPAALGFTHFHNLAPALPGATSPHPDFLQAIYVARAAKLVPDARVEDGNELEAAFEPVGQVQVGDLPVGQRLFLEAAVERCREVVR